MLCQFPKPPNKEMGEVLQEGLASKQLIKQLACTVLELKSHYTCNFIFIILVPKCGNRTLRPA